MAAPDRMLSWLRETLNAAGRDAEAATPGPWAVRPEPDEGENWEIAAAIGREQRWVIGAEGGGGVYDKPDADHIARHNPHAVLRRIAADRKQLHLHAAVPDHGRFSERGCPPLCDGEHPGPPVCRSCRTHAGDPVEAPCPTVENLAEAWGWTME